MAWADHLYLDHAGAGRAEVLKVPDKDVLHRQQQLFSNASAGNGNVSRKGKAAMPEL